MFSHGTPALFMRKTGENALYSPVCSRFCVHAFARNFPVKPHKSRAHQLFELNNGALSQSYFCGICTIILALLCAE